MPGSIAGDISQTDTTGRMFGEGVDKLTPNDNRFTHGYTQVNGRRWHYLDAPSTVPERGVVFLVHGWPDISFAWRYQIPLLASLGLRCIALDCIGYGLTGSSDDLAHFTYKTHADGIAGIAKALGYSRIVLGGHDWGGMVVWRTAQWYPELVTHVFSVATSFMPCSERYVSTEDLVKGPLPQFGYQLQLGDRKQEVGERVVGDRRMRRFLNGLYGGRSAQGKPVMTPEEGVDLDLICSEEEMVTKSPLLNDEELNYYTAQFLICGLKGPCNWYATRRHNYEDERALPARDRSQIRQPALFVQALNDNVLRPEMARGMERYIPNLTRGEVKAGHWALWHTPRETNESIRRWIEGVVFGGKSKL